MIKISTFIIICVILLTCLFQLRARNWLRRHCRRLHYWSQPIILMHTPSTYWYEEIVTYTVRCLYNAVSFLQNSHKRHVLTGELWGVCCEFEVWFTFCCCHRSAECHIVINWTALYRLLTILLALCEESPSVTSGFPSRRLSNTELWYFHCC